MPWPIENRIVNHFISAAKKAGREYIDLRPTDIADALGVSVRTASDAMRRMHEAQQLSCLYVTAFNSHVTKRDERLVYRLACVTPRAPFVPLKKAFVGPVVGIR